MISKTFSLACLHLVLLMSQCFCGFPIRLHNLATMMNFEPMSAVCFTLFSCVFTSFHYSGRFRLYSNPKYHQSCQLYIKPISPVRNINFRNLSEEKQFFPMSYVIINDTCTRNDLPSNNVEPPTLNQFKQELNNHWQHLLHRINLL